MRFGIAVLLAASGATSSLAAKVRRYERYAPVFTAGAFVGRTDTSRMAASAGRFLVGIFQPQIAFWRKL
jgi:hypothetical protein